ncbi:hypothetical protein LY90DRAFT_673613 [Neocallimastix californiae]|uniref:F-box domain-containing protein n=1 Tax=Neocallimastix californiae TaxID=1754190 RepID=A0A1Y2BAR4_9FUNG|nr:hypothetical protein LY90DRAFT_673613 [Neocallimastix californiae]|eukprot:ORY31903.1 hypothetical protein LY90DRAFT_673613 [Neocallimastix californiae]
MVKIFEPDYKHYKIPHEYLTYKNWKEDPNYLFDDSDEIILKRAEKDFILWKNHINELAFYNIFKWSDKKRIIPYQYSIFKKVSLDLWDRILSNLAFEDIKRFSLTSHYANEIVHLYCRQKYQRIIYSKRPAILYNISKANLVHSSYHTGLNLNSIKSTEFDIFEIFQSCLNNNSIYYIDLFEKFSCKKNLSTSFSNLLMNNYQHRSSDNVQYLNKSTYPNFYQTNQFSKFYGDILKESIRELLAFYNNDDDRNNIYNTIHFLINMSKDEGAKDNVHMNFNTTENILTMEIEKEDEINPETIEMPLPNSEDIVIPKIFRTFNLLIQNSCPFVNEGFIYQMFIPSQFCPTSDISFHALHDENYFKLILQLKYKKEAINWFEWLPFMGIHEQREREHQNVVNRNENQENQENQENNENPDQEMPNPNQAMGQQLNLNGNDAFNMAAINAIREEDLEREREIARTTRNSVLYININCKSRFFGSIGHLYKGRFEILTHSISEFIKTRALWNFMRCCGGKHEMLRNYLWPMLAEKEGCLYGFRRREVLSGACRGSLDDLAFSITNISYTSFIEFYRMLFDLKSLDYEILD